MRNGERISVVFSWETLSTMWSRSLDAVTTNGTAQTREFNAQNQITSISGQTTPLYDGNGNMTRDASGRTLVYDAWNRMVSVSSGSSTETFAYDGVGRRIRQTLGGSTTDLYYSAEWQVLEERVGGVVKNQYVWSPVYVDAMALRDSDTTAGGDLGMSGSGLDQRLYAQQDANWDVTALLNTSGTVAERFDYDPYGVSTARFSNSD